MDVKVILKTKCIVFPYETWQYIINTGLRTVNLTSICSAAGNLHIWYSEHSLIKPLNTFTMRNRNN